MDDLRKLVTGFSSVKVIIILFIAGVVGLLGWYSYLPKTAAQFHDRSDKAATEAATYTKSLAQTVGVPPRAIANEGVDQGCTIFPITAVGGNHAVNCTYDYYVYYLGSGSPQKDVRTIYDKVQTAGWDNQVGSSQTRYAQFQSDPTYFGAFPLSFQKKDVSRTIPDLKISIDLIHQSTYPSAFYNNTFYRNLAKKYLTKDNYVVGFTISERYVQASCSLGCIVNTP